MFLSFMNPNLEIIKAQFSKDNCAKHLNIVLDDLTETSVKMHMILREDMLNLFGRPHGAMIYSLADAAFSVIGNNNNNLSVALDCSISYHTSPNPGDTLFVDGELLTESKKTGSYFFKLYTQQNPNVLVASMKSTVYRTGKLIKE
jgi:acyl-CoA thioesterase